MTECKIVKVYEQDSTLTPKIVTFQNGELVNTKKLQCKSFINTKNNKTTIAIASDRLTYVGEVDESADSYTLLAIRNKNTNEVCLVPVHKVLMNVCIDKKNESLETTLKSSTINARDLDKQFGSKKRKKRAEQYERMNMNVSNVEDELKSTVANVSVKKDDLVPHTVNENAADYCPKINRTASKVKDIYDLHSIIKKDELDSLKDIAIAIIKKSVIEEQLSGFVLECIYKLKQASVTDIKKYEILLYIDVILKFFKLSTARLKNKTVKIKPYPQKIVNKALNEYTVPTTNSRLRPDSMYDKAVCYIIVLALLAMNYKLDLDSIATSMDVSIKKLRKISRILGAQPLSSNNRSIVVLKLPLPPPVTTVRGSKKK